MTWEAVARSQLADRKWSHRERLKAVSCEEQLKELGCPPFRTHRTCLCPLNFQRTKADVCRVLEGRARPVRGSYGGQRKYFLTKQSWLRRDRRVCFEKGSESPITGGVQGGIDNHLAKSSGEEYQIRTEQDKWLPNKAVHQNCLKSVKNKTKHHNLSGSYLQRF